MRLKLAVAVLLVCGVAFVLHQRKSAFENHLGAVATQLGQRHVHVHCQGLAGNLLDVTDEAGRVKFDPSGIPYDYTDLKKPICDALKRFPHQVRSAGYSCVLGNTTCPSKIWEDVLAVHTLAHETWHLHGISDEGRTECYALQTTAQAAELLGADAVSAQSTATYVYTHIYPLLPADYRNVPCANGGPNDLRPADPLWP